MPSMLEDKEAIRELLSLYCCYRDGQEDGKWLDLFASDGAWDGGQYGRYEGRNGLRQFQQLGKSMYRGVRHFTCNTVITVDGDSARAKSYVLVTHQTESGPALMMINHYDDYLVRQSGKWLFKLRRVHAEVGG